MASEHISSGGDQSNGEPETVDMSQVKIESVINDSKTTKSITFQGTYKDKPIVIRLDKTMFIEQSTKEALNNEKTLLNRSFVNDIYSSYTVTPAASAESLNHVLATIVWPANEAVLAKYTRDETIFFSETKDDYKNIVEPFINHRLNSDTNYNNWVYNILEGKSEIERVIYNDTDPDSGFMIIPDLKWSGSMEDIYLLAICHRRDIRSLRDLNEKHLPLLKNILSSGTKAIEDKFKACTSHLRSYVHYHPSFYHFHVHFKLVDASSYQSSDRDNLLTTIINNITLVGDYYARSTLTYPLSQSNALYPELVKADRVP